MESSLSLLDISDDSKNKLGTKFSNVFINNLNKKEHISYQDRIFSKKLKSTKNFLKDNPNLFFTSADKGNVTVCLEKNTYVEKMTNLLFDPPTYTVVKRNPLNMLKNNTSKVLKNLNDNEFLSIKYHNNDLTFFNTELSRAYGLPKIHKQNTPLRPIISLVNSPTYLLSKLFVQSVKK